MARHSPLRPREEADSYSSSSPSRSGWSSPAPEQTASHEEVSACDPGGRPAGELTGPSQSGDGDTNILLLKAEASEETDVTALLRFDGAPGAPEEGEAPAPGEVAQGRPEGRIFRPARALRPGRGRSKLGCLTCRRRKKKCDEEKPRCMNCSKNALICEGYPERKIWRSGRDGAREADFPKLDLSRIILQPLIIGIETDEDRVFLEYYVSPLSDLLSIETGRVNAFRYTLLPASFQHLGLMHSLLSLASRHIDYRSPYGRSLLGKYPGLDEARLHQRSQFHHEQALIEFNLDVVRQASPSGRGRMVSARFGQILCFVLESLVEGKSTGEHRIHLEAYQQLIRESPAEDSPYLGFMKPYFTHYIQSDLLISHPTRRGSLGGPFVDVPPLDAAVEPEGDALGPPAAWTDLYSYMNQITRLRDSVRESIKAGEMAAIYSDSFCRASEIDASIRTWTPSWPAGDTMQIAGPLYKQMLWVYLWLTIYPPCMTTRIPDDQISIAVAGGLDLLSQIPPDDSALRLVLVPTFIIGCAALEPEQRALIRERLRTIKQHTNLRNTDRASELLEEVWRLTDLKSELSWDWQTIAHGRQLDFLIA